LNKEKEIQKQAHIEEQFKAIADKRAAAKDLELKNLKEAQPVSKTVNQFETDKSERIKEALAIETAKLQKEQEEQAAALLKAEQEALAVKEADASKMDQIQKEQEALAIDQFQKEQEAQAAAAFKAEQAARMDRIQKEQEAQAVAAFKAEQEARRGNEQTFFGNLKNTIINFFTTTTPTPPSDAPVAPVLEPSNT
jgi:hypothetical protein